MSASVTSFRPPRQARALRPGWEGERWVRRRVQIAWGLLVLNVVTFYSGMTLVVPIPSTAGKVITQGAAPAALLLALTVNRRVIVRPNVFLCLVTLLVVEAVVTGLHPQYLGTVYRTVRLGEFVAALWLLSPWWGRRDMVLLRAHLASYTVVLGTVVLGLVLSPGNALYQGRLTGVLWPIPPTQVAHYAAVTAGLVAVLWLAGALRGRIALPACAAAGTMLVLTHTRTALIAVVAGVLVAGLSLFTARARARRFFTVLGAGASVVVIMLTGAVAAWLMRGENSQQLSDLTGRTKVWSMLVDFPRNWFQVAFGFGLGNKSFNGLPIDSNWLASYNEQGLFGVVVCAAILLFLLVAAYFQPRGPRRALALFLTTYCLVASVTEVGFTDASTYMLELTLAASMLCRPARRRAAHPDGAAAGSPPPIPAMRNP